MWEESGGRRLKLPIHPLRSAQVLAQWWGLSEAAPVIDFFRVFSQLVLYTTDADVPLLLTHWIHFQAFNIAAQDQLQLGLLATRFNQSCFTSYPRPLHTFASTESSSALVLSQHQGSSPARDSTCFATSLSLQSLSTLRQPSKCPDLICPSWPMIPEVSVTLFIFSLFCACSFRPT